MSPDRATEFLVSPVRELRLDGYLMKCVSGDKCFT